MFDYVHGYSSREAERLRDQAAAVAMLLHHDTAYPAGARVLEGGCGVGAQTLVLARQSPEAQFTSVDICEDSLREAERVTREAGLTNVTFEYQNLHGLPYSDDSFDHAVLCFVLEHLSSPARALASLRRVLRPRGTVTVVEGDHGSCYWHPETPASRRVWQCLIECQEHCGGDSLIGRRLHPLLSQAKYNDLVVSPRMVYCDASTPQHRTAFVKNTIAAMVAGVRDQALAEGMVDEVTWQAGLRDLQRVAEVPQGVFCYTFFKAVGAVPAPASV